MSRKCKRCETKTIWTQEPPLSVHAYRVECAMCKCFLMWGTQSQLGAAMASGMVYLTIPYRTSATLEAFLSD
jgi:hypothetical protein